MATQRHTVEQIIPKLREAAGQLASVDEFVDVGLRQQLPRPSRLRQSTHLLASKRCRVAYRAIRARDQVTEVIQNVTNVTNVTNVRNVWDAEVNK